MEHLASKNKSNPLASLMRQPKIYIKLPSKGKYWEEGSLNLSINGEYPVYSMTAKDELLLKTPDALMNGQAVVDVIQNCMPNIVDAWQTPNIDLDVILIAIRLATYGPTMDTSVTIGTEEMNYGIDLRNLLDILNDTISWEEKIEIGEHLALYIKPINYATVNQTSMKNFETQKMMSLVNDSTLSEEEKVNQFRESFNKLTNITLGIINTSVYKVKSTAGTTEDRNDIDEFMNNCDKEIFDAVKNRLDELRIKNTLKPIKVKSSPEMLAAGANEEMEIPLTFDPANFFA
jgi:hypothetical protein